MGLPATIHSSTSLLNDRKHLLELLISVLIPVPVLWLRLITFKCRWAQVFISVFSGRGMRAYPDLDTHLSTLHLRVWDRCNPGSPHGRGTILCHSITHGIPVAPLQPFRHTLFCFSSTYGSASITIYLELTLLKILS